jgi:hypothetical protein
MIRRLALAFSLLALGAAAPRDASALVLGFSPTSVPGSVGDSVSVDVVATALGSDVIGSFDLDVLFDSSVLLATNVVFGTALGSEALFEAFTDFDLTTAGVVDFAEVSFLSLAQLDVLQSDPITLATLHFNIIGPGQSALTFRLDVDNVVTDADGDPLEVVTRSGSVGTSTAVPEPSAALVFAAGCALVATRVRRARAAA